MNDKEEVNYTIIMGISNPENKYGCISPGTIVNIPNNSYAVVKIPMPITLWEWMVMIDALGYSDDEHMKYELITCLLEQGYL